MPSARRIAWFLFAASLVLRAGVAAELLDTPIVIHHEWTETDNHFFVTSAERVAAGDWLGEAPHHPYHGWHALLAKRQARDLGVAYDEAWGERLWNEWYGGARYHQEPLYTWLLAVLIGLFGDARWAFALQAVGGALSTALVFLVSLRLLRAAAPSPAGDAPTLSQRPLWLAVGAAVAHLLYGPLAYYDLMLHRTSVQGTVGLLVTWAALRALDRPGCWRRAALLGLLGGASVILVSTGLPFVLLLLTVSAWGAWRDAARRLAFAALLGAFALALSPAVVRNLSVGVAPLELSSVGAITFINANAEDVDPAGGFTVSRHAHRIMAESHGQLGAAARLTLATHTGAGWLKLLAAKAAVFFDPVEVPNNDSYAYYRGWSYLLSLSAGFAPYGWLLVLGLVGGLSTWRRSWPALVPLLVGLGVTLAFYNLSRFRAPLVVLALPLAAVGAEALTGWVKARRWRPLAGAALAVLAVVAVRATGERPPSAVRPVDVLVGTAFWQKLARDNGPEASEIIARAALDGPDVGRWLEEEERWTAKDRREVVAAILGLDERGARLSGTPGPYQAAADALIAAAKAADQRK